uniref:Apolipoprotein M n=1 Tax=Hippocampus comes TaxID=109280 RepID=A0A3Q2Z2Q8_HIPCM
MTWPVFHFLFALATLCGASAPDCKDLVQPLLPGDPQLVFGKWVYVMGAGDPRPYHEALASLKSSWIDLSPTSESNIVALRFGDYSFNRCIFEEVNVTVVERVATFRKNLADHKGYILRTCSDCLLWTGSFRNHDVTGRFILQFTRSGAIDPQDVEMFKKQISCLNFPENFHKYDGITQLCPDDKQAEE